MNKKSQALILTIAILSVLMIIGVSLLLLSFYEVRHSRIYLDSIKAQYLAEAGVVLGRSLLSLDKKKNITDSFQDFFYKDIEGEDVDLNGDGVKESKWFEVSNSQGKPYGKFALKITDEASKLNLNYSGEGKTANYGLSFFELDIDSLFSSLGINKKGPLVERRFGEDKKPGLKNVDDDSDNSILNSDGIDNDLDGIVDESDEGIDEEDEQGFGDDRLFLAPEEVLDSLTVPQNIRFKDYFTVYSKDKELDNFGKRRVYINTNSFEDVVLNFLISGVSLPFQKAANFIDCQDKDLKQTILDKFYKRVALPNPTGGGFRKIGNYLYAPPGSSESTFNIENLDIEDGEYFCFFHSPYKDMPVGFVSVGKVEDCDVYSGEGLYSQVKVEGGSLEIKIKPFKDKSCYVDYLELISLDKKEGFLHIPIRGREALVINEVMIKPSLEFLVSKEQNPKGSWVWKGSFYENSEFASGKEGEGKWVFHTKRRGYFYIKVIAHQAGGYVGDVVISGEKLSAARDGMVFPSPIYIDRKLEVTIQNNSLVEVATFKGVIISQEPDTEFIELLNISPHPIDLSNFSLEAVQEGSGILGWPAIIPQGTTIASYQHLVLAIDKDDRSSPLYLRNNGISLQKTWGIDSVQLQFTGAIEGRDDVIPNKGATIILKNPQGQIVDIVEYNSSQVKDFISIERSDPTLFSDSDSNGIFDGWFFSDSLAKATPSQSNDNAGMREIDPKTLQVFYHNVREQTVLNKPFINIGYAKDTASGFAWERFSMRDISLLSDRFTSFIKPLGIHSFIEGSFKKEEDGFSSFHKDEWGLWKFSNIPQGVYSLKVLADKNTTSSISIATSIGSSESFDYLGPFYFDKGWVNYGSIEIKEVKADLEVKIRNDEDKPLKILDFILEPKFQIAGRININTASQQVLSCLTDSYTSSKIISNRPYGEKTDRKLGIGDLLTTDALGFSDAQKLDKFKLIAPFITTRSDIYEVISQGEFGEEGKIKTSHTIDAVIER